MLKGDFNRKKKRHLVCLGAVLALFVHVTLYVLLNLSAKHPGLLFGCYAFVILLVPVLFLLLESEKVLYWLSSRKVG